MLGCVCVPSSLEFPTVPHKLSSPTGSCNSHLTFGASGSLLLSVPVLTQPGHCFLWAAFSWLRFYQSCFYFKIFTVPRLFSYKSTRLLVLLSISPILLENSCCQPWEAQHHFLYPLPIHDAQPQRGVEAIPFLQAGAIPFLCWLWVWRSRHLTAPTAWNRTASPHHTKGREWAHSPSDRIYGQNAELTGSQWPGQVQASYPPILQEYNQAPTCGKQLHKSNSHVSFSESSRN